MIQGLVLTPMRARVALDKNVFWCLSSVFKRPRHVRGVVVGFLRRMLRDCSGLAPGDPLCRIAVLREVEEMTRF